MSAPKTTEQKAKWKALRVEVNNPVESNEWKILWQLDEDDWMKTKILIDALNIINAPVQLRIAPNEQEE